MDINDFSKKLENFKKNLPNTNHEFNKRLGREFVELAKPRTPVDTGLSRESWRYEHSPEKVTIRNIAKRNGVFYAEYWNRNTYIEYPDIIRTIGTDTLDIVKNMIKQKLQEIYEEELKRAWENA